MAIYITDNSDNVSGALSPTLADFSTDFDGEYTSPGTSSFDGSLNRALEDFQASFNNVDFPNLRNVFSTYVISPGGVDEMLNQPNDPNYLWARITPMATVAISDLPGSDTRPTRAAQWKALKDDNPLFHGVFHAQPWVECQAARENQYQWYRVMYDICQRYPRQEAILNIDGTDLTELNCNERAATGNNNINANDTQFIFNMYTDGCRDELANAIVDMLAGSNLYGGGWGAGDGSDDLSDFMSFMFDATQLLIMVYNKKLCRPYTGGEGTVESIDAWTDSTGTHVQTMTVTCQPGSSVVPSTGNRGASVMIFSNTSQLGFIGYRVDSYTELSGGRSQVGLRALRSQSSGVSQIQPQAGWRVCFLNRENRTESCDWEADGTTDGDFRSYINLWAPAWTDMWDRVESRMGTETGHPTGRGWNAIAASYEEKRLRGWQSPHQLANSADQAVFENCFRDVGWQADRNGNHEYNIRGSRVFTFDKCMRGLYFTDTFSRTPTAWMASKPFGRSSVETMVWGSNYNDINALDATTMRFHMALTLTIPSLCHSGVLEFSGNNPVIIEENFIDLDTNYDAWTPTALGTYDDAGGGDGSSGYPIGSFTPASPQAGERIYVRRVGNWLVILNCRDFPSDYNPSTSFYIPSHLPGGYTPDASLDTITPADWGTIALLYFDGGETLRHFDPSTYVNQRVTDWLQTEAPNHWGSGNPSGPFNYGPQQAHPNDGDGQYTVATLPLIARDPTRNDGSAVDMNANYALGPMEAVFLEIV